MWIKRVVAMVALGLAGSAVLLAVRHHRLPAPRAAVSTPVARTKRQAPARPRIHGAAARRMAVPILMYHVISAAPAGVPNPELWVDRHVFADEMRALRAAGYEAVTLREVDQAWRHGGPLPRRPVVISFDDGYLSQYTHAKPVLRALGWPGVLNLELKSVGPGGLTEHQVRSLIDAGWEVDSHTLTHPDLTTLDAAALTQELSGSRAELRRRFGVRADFLAYPAGRYNARVEAAARAAGYRLATTTDEGVARGRDDPYALKRIRVDASDTAQALVERLGSVR